MARGIREREDSSAFSEEAESLWRLTLGPLTWGVHFLVSYAATAIYCAKFATRSGGILGFRLGIGALTLVALACIVWVAWRAWRQWDLMDDWDYVHEEGENEDRHEFLGHAAFLLAIIAFVGVIYVALPILFIRTCL